jgi:hypothetical protein
VLVPCHAAADDVAKELGVPVTLIHGERQPVVGLGQVDLHPAALRIDEPHGVLGVHVAPTGPLPDTGARVVEEILERPRLLSRREVGKLPHERHPFVPGGQVDPPVSSLDRGFLANI